MYLQPGSRACIDDWKDVEDPDFSMMHCIECWRNAGSDEQKKCLRFLISQAYLLLAATINLCLWHVIWSRVANCEYILWTKPHCLPGVV